MITIKKEARLGILRLLMCTLSHVATQSINETKEQNEKALYTHNKKALYKLYKNALYKTL